MIVMLLLLMQEGDSSGFTATSTVGCQQLPVNHLPAHWVVAKFRCVVLRHSVSRLFSRRLYLSALLLLQQRGRFTYLIIRRSVYNINSTETENIILRTGQIIKLFHGNGLSSETVPLCCRSDSVEQSA